MPARQHASAAPHGPDLGRAFACVVLFVLSLVGAAAISLPFLFRLPSIRTRIDHFVVDTVKSETGLDIALEIDRPLWPPGVLVRNVRVASKDPARPFATVREARVTLRPFALLSGEVVIDAVELDGLNVDAEMKEGEAIPTNLPLVLKPSTTPKTKQIDPPFRQLSLTGAHLKVKYSPIDVTAEPSIADVTELDLDVDATAEGATTIYNLRMDRAAGSIRSPRLQLSPPPYDRFLHKKVVGFAPHKVWDEDALCGLSIHAQITDAPAATTFSLRRFELDAHLDGDEALGTAPSCLETEVADEQVLHVRLLRADAEMPKNQGVPHLRIGPAAKLHVQVPAMFAARYVKLPSVGGWLALDLDVGADIDMREPMTGVLKANATGRIEAHEVRLEQYRFGESIIGDISIKQPLTISSNKLDVKYGEGLVSITNFELRAAPQVGTKKQLPMKATVAIKGVTFPGLIRELGVSKASHVRWDLDDGLAHLSGFLDPLQLDGDLSMKTKNFELGVNEVEGYNPGHIVGVHSPIAVDTRLAIRDKFFEFQNVRARWGTSSIAARVYLGFDERLEVDAKSDALDLSEASPLVMFPVDGNAKLDYKVRGTFADPIGEGTATIGGFDFDDFALGDVETTTAKFRGHVVEISGYRAHKGNSAYSVSSLRVDLGEGKGAPITVDGLGESGNFDLDDFYRIFHLEDDPRWVDVKGHVAFGAQTHLVVGGKDDPCGSGHLTIGLDARVLAMDLYGERYDGGSMETTIDWYDFGAGGLGMDLDLHAGTLHKKGGGDVVVSGKILRGGRLDLHANAGGLSLRNLSTMPETSTAIDGTIDASADVGGTFDDMTVDADVSLSPIHIADRVLGRSHLHVVRRPLPTIRPSPPPDAKGCYTGRRFPPFDALKWNEDAVQGEYAIAGSLFGDSVKLDDVRVTDQRNKVASGKIEVRALDVGPLAMLRPRNDLADLSDKYEPPPTPMDVEGKVSADVVLDKLPFAEWWNGKGKISNLTLDLETGNMGVATTGAPPTITFGPEGARLPETSLNVTFGDSQTVVTLAAEIDRTQLDAATGSPKLSAKLVLPKVPLSRIEQFYPRLERADGTLHATLSVDGTVAAPTWSGEVVVENGAFGIRGFQMPISNVNGRIDVDPKTGIRIAKLHGEVGGGTIDVTGGGKLHGFAVSDVDVRVAARDVHMKYGDGIQLTLGGDLRATWSPPDPGSDAKPMDIVGTVDVDSFLYERDVKVFDVNSLQTAQRTDVEAYDPTRDVAMFDVELRSKGGFHLRNNLADATVVIGPAGLRAVGSNQRWGLLGELNVVPGGVFKFRNHDFEIREGKLKFTDETKIDPNIDVSATTDYRRAAGAGSSAAAEWRIKLHAYGTSSDLKLELTSDPPLSQEDAVLLLTVGMTRAEANALGGGGVAGGAGLDFLANIAGVDQTVKQAIPVIDDFRFGTAYSVKTGRTEPQITLGKRLTDNLRASITSGFGEQREVLSNIEWQLSQKMSVQGSYDNINDVTSSSVGNVGVDLRYRLEFE